MESNFPGFYEKHDKDFVTKSMKKYIYEKQEMDKQLENLIKPIIKDKNCNILDACCGIGHISYHLSDINPNSSFLGVDLTPFLIEEGREICKNKKNITLENADINEIKNKYPKNFDISIAWKAISWMPHYDEFLKSLMEMTKGHIFLNSPFYDGDIDFITKVYEYKNENLKNSNRFLYYNVYSLPRFERFVKDLGAKNLEVYDFDIPFDIPRPPIDRMGTYTEKLEDGKRLQRSGAVIMSWKTVRIDL
jgi:ubiquinone/menaquinone biosynthesis C-methylase UbiE